MIIDIEDLKFKTIIGILDFERKKPQKVVVDISIKYDFKYKYIDYVYIIDKVKKMMKKNKYELIEDALKDISLSIKAEFENIKWIKMKIKKPDIIKGCMVGVKSKF
jgi:dihydroneopterin aldolase